jgi:hypothetical protein
MGKGNNMITVKEVVRERKYKAGYVIRDEYWDDGSKVDNLTLMKKMAYTKEGDWIGDSKWAHMLYFKYGIKPEKNKADHCVCSIGFSAKDKKWYGWSHRAICGFGKGSKIKIGMNGFEPSNRDEFIKHNLDFWMWDKEDHDYDVKITNTKIILKSTYKPTGVEHTQEIKIPKKYSGRGEWTAKTLDDAKEMACAFAEDVS